MVKVDQTLHMEGQYVPLDEPAVLYCTQIHQYGHMVWLWGYVPSNPLRVGAGEWGLRGGGAHYVCP